MNLLFSSFLSLNTCDEYSNISNLVSVSRTEALFSHGFKSIGGVYTSTQKVSIGNGILERYTFCVKYVPNTSSCPTQPETATCSLHVHCDL